MSEKLQNLNMKITASDKVRVIRAAKYCRQTMTSFVLTAVEHYIIYLKERDKKKR